MKFKLTRDINQASKRERIAAGIVSSIAGAGLILVSDLSMGEPIEASIRNIAITAVVGIVFCYVYGHMQKRKTGVHREKKEIA